MFKNKAVQMKLVNDTSSNTIVLPDPTRYTRIAEAAVLTGREAVKGTAVLIGTYVAADTVRRIAVHIIATKVH